LLNVASGVFGGAALLTWISQSYRDKDMARLERGVGSALGATFAGALIAGVVALALAPVILPHAWSGEARGFVALVAVSQVFTLLQSVVVHLHIGLGDLRAVTLSSILSALVSTALSVALVLVFGLPGQFWSLAIGGACSLFITVWLLYRREGVAVSLKPARDTEFLKFAFTAGTVMLVSGYASQLLLSFARYSLEAIGTGKQGTVYNGHFQAAWMIGSTYFGVLLGGVGNYFYPRFAMATDAKALTAEIDHAVAMALRYAPALAIAAITFRDVVVAILYSGQFELAGELLGFLLAADIARAVTWSYLGALPMRGKVKALLVVEGSNAILGAALFWAGAHLGGPLGLAAASWVLACVMCPLTALVTSKVCDVTIGWKSIAAGLGLAGVGILINLGMHYHWAARVVAVVISSVLLWRSGAHLVVWNRLVAMRRPASAPP
jgi:O-antigen/teichoic acid export membrane protein